MLNLAIDLSNTFGNAKHDFFTFHPFDVLTGSFDLSDTSYCVGFVLRTLTQLQLCVLWCGAAYMLSSIRDRLYRSHDRLERRVGIPCAYAAWPQTLMRMCICMHV